MKYIPIRIIFDGSPFSYLQSAKGPRVLRNSMKTASDDLLSPIETTLGGAWAKVWRVIKGYTNKITYLTRFHCMGRGRLKIMSNSWGIPHTGTEKSDKVCIMLLVHLIPQNLGLHWASLAALRLNLRYIKCVTKVLEHLSKPAAPTSVPGLLRHILLKYWKIKSNLINSSSWNF